MSIFFVRKKTLGICAFLVSVIVSSGTYAGSGGVGLGATRVIYNSDRAEVPLSVSNTDPDNVYLIQSWIDTSEGQPARDFLITPPLFKIKKKSENTLRLIYTGSGLADDRETLFLVNVKAIPSKSKAAMQEGQSTLQLAVVSRIKLFYRPAALAGASQAAGAKIEVERKGDTVILRNPTPFFINLTKMAVGKYELASTMVAPFAEEQIELPKGTNGELTYSFLNDYGAAIKIK